MFWCCRNLLSKISLFLLIILLTTKQTAESIMSAQTGRKVILITGATGGIGHATAVTFAKTGEYDLALHYHHASAETRDALLAEIKATNSNVQADFFQADMGNFASVRAMHEDVTDRFHKVDILFANAGSTLGFQGVKSLADVPMDVFEKTWRVNTGSAILLAQLCLPEMEAQGWGRIIFDSSVAAFTGGFVGPHYASSKSAMHGFVHWLAGSVARKGVTVNAIAPAVIRGTAMLGDNEEETLERAKNSESSLRLIVFYLNSFLR